MKRLRIPTGFFPWRRRGDGRQPAAFQAERVPCPKCNAPLVLRMGRLGPYFFCCCPPSRPRRPRP